MKKSLLSVYVILLFLTLVSAVISSASFLSKTIVLLLMGLAAAKFILVAFHFMELKLANSFWKIALTSFLVVINSIVILLLV